MLERFHRINQAAGISIFIADDGNLQVAACSVSINNTELTISQKAENVLGLEKLKEVLPAKSYVALNLSGGGVLYKQVEKIDEIDNISFNKVLPNASLNDFYVQNFISGDHSFVSIVRKSEADRWIDQMTELGFTPLMLSLGPFLVQQIIPQLNFYDPMLVFNGYTILRNERGDWESFSANPSETSRFPIKIQSETLHERLVIPYACAFQLAQSDRLNPIQAKAELPDSSLRKVLQERKLKVQAFAALVVIFVLLLANFITFSSLNSANGELMDQVSRSAQSSDDIQKINNEVEKKQRLLNVLGWEGNVSKSGLIDQVASLLPPELTWRQVSVDPVDLTASRRQKTVVFSTRQIRITGTSEKIIPVNEWIARIKTRSWVKNVVLDNYSFNSELNTGQFTVIINY